MDYTGSIYRLIDRAEDEMKEYAQRVKQLSADEIYRHSAETAAKESLLSALIHDSYELDDDDLDLILKPKNPVEALYQFLTSDKTDLSSESSISSILSEYNAQCQAVQVLPAFIAKQQLDTFATELVREAEIAGRIGPETDRREQALREQTGLDPEIEWSDTGRIQLNEEVTVTLTHEIDLGLFAGFGSFPITLRADATGKSEVYWK